MVTKTTIRGCLQKCPIALLLFRPSPIPIVPHNCHSIQSQNWPQTLQIHPSIAKSIFPNPNKFYQKIMFPIAHFHLLPILCLTFAIPIFGTISNNFRTFIQNRFGRNVANLLARDDLGEVGSYGGGDHVAGEKTDNLPIIFVHGLLTSATTTEPIAAFFQSAGGYTDAELYATTYGPRSSLIWNAALECQYSLAFRYLIIGVSEFTNSQVNVIAYSLGVPVVRKAMLGGQCVSGGDLGQGVLTRYVNTFIAVAGPNNGIAFCSLPLAGLSPTCNLVNGLRCGSRFLRDINERQPQHYEASQSVFVIQSTGDLTVGNVVCGLQTTAVPGADFTLTFEDLTHIQVITLTAEQQFNLITKRNVN